MNTDLTIKEIRSARRQHIFTITGETDRGYVVRCFRMPKGGPPILLSQARECVRPRTARRRAVELVRAALCRAHVSLPIVLLLLTTFTLLGCGGAPFSALPSTVTDPSDAASAVADTRPTDAPSPSSLPDAADSSPLPDAAPPACLPQGLVSSTPGGADFRIAFTLTTSASGSTYALLSQGPSCPPPNTPPATVPSPFWAITLDSSGGLTASTGDGFSAADGVFVESGSAVNDGRAHEVVFARTGGKIGIWVDGNIDSSLAPDGYEWVALAPLEVGVSACPATAEDLGNHGVVRDVCVTGSGS